MVASLFVNPTQFAPGEDFAAYPRDEARDADLLSANGLRPALSPLAGTEIYPPGFSTTVTVAGLSAPLEGESRPDHFAGVATVVAKLLIHAQPDVAVFGEKDYQQLLVVRAPGPRPRPAGRDRRRADRARPDGLALSSRNAYLTPASAAVAPALNGALRSAGERWPGAALGRQVEAAGRAALRRRRLRHGRLFRGPWRRRSHAAWAGPGQRAGPHSGGRRLGRPA